MAPVLLLTPQPSRGSSRRGQGRPARPCAHGAFRKLVGEDAGTLETRAVPAGPRRCCSQARVPHLPCGDLGGRASPFFLPPCVAVDSGVSNSREEISERVQIACVFVCLSSLKTVARRGGSPRLKLSAGRRRRLRRRPRGPSGPACRRRPEAAFVPRPRPASWGLGRDSPPGWGRARNCPECQRLRGAVFIQGQGTPGSSHSRHGDRRVSGFWRAGRGARASPHLPGWAATGVGRAGAVPSATCEPEARPRVELVSAPFC